MMTQEVLQAVSTVGFPIVACGYLMIRMEGTIKENTKAINVMAQQMAKQIGVDNK